MKWGRIGGDTSPGARCSATDDATNPGKFTIRALAEEVIELTGSRSTLVFSPLLADDPMQRQPIAYFDKLLSGTP